MKKNLHILDRILRTAIALVIAALYFSHVISGLWASILGLVAVIFLATSFMSYCPLYHLIGFSTNKNNK